MNRMNNRSLFDPAGLWRLPLLLLTAILLCCAACGRKDLPVPPPSYIPPPVIDFSGELVGGQVLLAWTLPAADHVRRLSGAVIRVFRAERSLSAVDGCPECPPAYTRVADYPVRKMRPNAAGRLEGVLRQAVEPDYRYWYYVVVRSDDGVDGPPSVDVQLTYPLEDR